MKKVSAYIASIACALILSVIAQGQTQTSSADDTARAEVRGTEANPSSLIAQVRPGKSNGFSFIRTGRDAAPSVFTITPMASGSVLPVTGSGTSGRLTKWSGFTSSNSSIGDSTIFEDKFGLVGIGTDSPTSRLTVIGLIESAGGGGGVKFPDATIQTTAFDPNQVVRSLNGLHGDLTLAAGANITVTPSAGKTLTIAAPDVLTSVSHNSTLVGNGTGSSPLSIANGGVGTAQLASNGVTADKIASGQVLKGLNGLTDQIMLAAGANISITPNGNKLTIASTTADPALTAFQAELSVQIPGGDHVYNGEVQIPANKRLVIEYMSMALGANGLTDCTVTTHIGNGGDVHHGFTMVKDPDHLIFAADHLVRIYADGSVKVLVSTSEANLGSGGLFTISGYLVDLP
jgi:hypothetical protein